MLKPLQQDLLKSIDELFDSEVLLDGLNVEILFGHRPKYQNVLKNNRMVKLFNYTDASWHGKAIKNNIAVISHMCDRKGKSFPGMYIIPEFFYTQHPLVVRPYHPYLDKLQNLMDRSLEAGLLMAWKIFFFNDAKAFIPNENNFKRIVADEKAFLDFEAIGPFFIILIVGFSGALLALFCEIFHHDFLKQISKKLLKMILRKNFKKTYKKVRGYKL